MDSTANKKIRVTPVVDTMPADLLTPLAVYLKLSANAESSFLLESVEGGTSLARYSFIGANAEKRIDGNTVAQLREHFSEHEAEPDPELPPFIGGTIGYLGFDCCSWFEPSLRDEDFAPESEMLFFRTIVAFDHARQLIKIISLDFEGDSSGTTAEARNASVRSLIDGPLGKRPSVAAPSDATGSIRSNSTREAFEASVTSVKELISAGECYQVVLSQCFSRPTDAGPVSIYRALRSLNPSPYMFLLDLGARQVIGASPEMLVRCSGSKVEYRPIAGTRKRGRTQDEDAALADDMKRDQKEVAEHLMLVDLGRNDLGRIADFGSVSVDSLMHVEKYSHVQHLVSSLSATLAPGKDRFDALASCFPAGTVSGAPKVRAIEIIRGLEPTKRGVYAGAVGYFDYAGNMDTCIAIRTLVLENGVAKVQAGAGIVADSDPSAEFDETVNKARGLLRAVEIAEEGNL